MSSSDPPLFGAPTTTTPLFVGPTKTPATANGGEGQGPQVYYLVFLGVVVALIGVASGLAWRGYAVRRRHRTAAQLALARGDPVPPLTWWGTAEEDTLGFGVFRPVERDKLRRWGGRIPALCDAVLLDDEKEGLRRLEIDEPLMLMSRLPDTGEAVPIDVTRARAHAFRRYVGLSTPSPPPEIVREADRLMTPGEPVAVAVVVQMPVEPRSGASSTSSFDEGVGWRPGMELGLWEGLVGESSGQEYRHGAPALSRASTWSDARYSLDGKQDSVAASSIACSSTGPGIVGDGRR